MGKFGDWLGTVRKSFQIGDRTSGTVSLKFHNGFLGSLQANHTADRVWQFPDESLTLGAYIPNVYFRGGIVSDSHGTVQTIVAANGFNTIPITTVFNNSHSSNFDSTNFTFEIPIKGLYSILTRLRLTESTSQVSTPNGYSGGQSFISYGQGCHTLNVDGNWFHWDIVVPPYSDISAPRNSSLNIREAEFNVGDKLRMYAYFDGGTGGKIVNSELIIRLIKAT